MQRIMLIVLAGSIVLTGQVVAQSVEKPKQVLFHVVSTKSGEDPDTCKSLPCAATKVTVEGYVDSGNSQNITEYILRCVEVMNLNPSRYASSCTRVHASTDYDALLWSDSIGFITDTPKRNDNAIQAMYDIVSEKEVSKHRK